MIWYFIEGHAKRKWIASMKTITLPNTSYTSKEKHIDLKFFKSEVSGKWWVANIIDSEEKEFWKIPCSYEEYQASAKDKIPPRILHLIN